MVASSDRRGAETRTRLVLLVVTTLGLLGSCRDADLSTGIVAKTSPRARPSSMAVACDVSALIVAINTANDETLTPGPDTIELTLGCNYVLTAISDGTPFWGGSGLPSILSDITINGNGATIERSTASGTNDFRLFTVLDVGNLTANNLTLRNGRVTCCALVEFLGSKAFHGGAVLNLGRLTLNAVTVAGTSRMVSAEGSRVAAPF